MKARPAAPIAAKGPLRSSFRALLALLPITGTAAPAGFRAPTPSRRAPRVLCGVLGALALLLVLAAPALAATPEAPETTAATAITATTATLHGVLNPAAPSEGGGYRFTYRQSETECEPEGTFRPELPALSKGEEKEAVSAPISGLEPNKPYTFCLIASNLSAEATTGSLAHFTTLALPPAIDSESASAVNSASANLEALVNTNNEATTYSFQYATEASGEKLEGTVTTLPGGELPPAFGDQAAGVPTGPALSEGTTYFYRVIAENEASEEEGEPAKGKVQSFTTVPAPHTDAVTAITATSATFNGHLNLNSLDTTFSFAYNLGGECANGPATAPEDAGSGAGAKALSTEASGLQPSATYSVCLISSNAFGQELDPTSPPVSFTTPAAPPSVDSETATVTPFEATLEALLNANNQETTYRFQYATDEAMSENLKTLSPPEGTVLQGYGDQGAGVQTGPVLTPGTTYYYRVIAENAAHEKTEGAVTELTIPALEKPTIEPGSVTASAIGSRRVQFEALVNPDYQETSWVFEYATDEAFTQNVGSASGLAIPAVGGAQNVSVLALDLLPAHEYYFRITATNGTGTTQGSVITPPFTTLAVPLVEETEPQVSEITPHGALITNITINPQVAEPTEELPTEEATYYVLYGETEAYGQALPAPTHRGAGYGFTGAAVAPVQLYGLSAATTYHFALLAHNPNGTRISRDYQFTTAAAEPLTTPPGIGSSSAQFVNEESAILEAEIDPEGLPTSYEVQYGTSNAYGQSTPPAAIAPFTSMHGTITALTGLAPATTYHYRLIASNQAGTINGPDRTFTTTGAARSGAFAPFNVPFAYPPVQNGGGGLTKRQKLAAALKACRAKAKGPRRRACEKAAHAKYAAKPNSHKGGK